jgi:hypothetical protein
MRILITLLLVTGVAAADPKADLALRKRVCDVAVRAATRIATCKLPGLPPGYSFESARESVTSHRDAPAGELDRDVTGTCANVVLGFIEGAKQAACDLKLPAADVGAVEAFAESWHNERTKPRVTGDAAADKQLASMVAVRDRMCACKAKDHACLDAIEKERSALVYGKFTGKTGELVLADGERVLKEASRCQQALDAGIYRARKKP